LWPPPAQLVELGKSVGKLNRKSVHGGGREGRNFRNVSLFCPVPRHLLTEKCHQFLEHTRLNHRSALLFSYGRRLWQI